MMLGLAAILIQKHAYKDETMPAVAKGLLWGCSLRSRRPCHHLARCRWPPSRVIVLYSSKRQLTETHSADAPLAAPFIDTAAGEV